MGALLRKDPSAAHRELAKRFKAAGPGGAKEVARVEGVDVATLQRWLVKLRELGFDDPRGGLKPRLGPESKFDAKATHAKLSRLFARGLNRGQVASELNVNAATVHRWIEQVVELGFGDPREGHEPKVGRGRPAKKRSRARKS